ncbi:MAG: tetratricopeptide repeat protein [Myxococcota bacterium]
MDTYQTTLLRAVQLLEADDLSRAARLCQQLIDAHPDGVGAYHLMGRILSAAGRPDDALQALDRAAKIAPDEPEIRFDQALIFQEAGRLEDAVTHWRAGLDISPRTTEAWMHLGGSLYEMGRLVDAERAYHQATEVDPEDPMAHFNRGLTLEALGRYADAVRAYQEVEIIDPMDVDAILRLVEMFLVLDRPADALAALIRARRLRPGDLDLRSRLHRLTTEYPTARPEAEQRARQLFDSPERWCNAALSAERRGDRPAAIKALRRALEVDGDHPTARHLYDAYNGNASQSPPPGYVQQLFDDYAPRFEGHLVEELGYRLPVAMFELQQRLHLPTARLLDLGCGTGLVGESFRTASEEIIGVDLSGRMLSIARTKDVYDALYQADLVDWLRQGRGQFDLMTAADVLIYMGAVERLLGAVTQRLHPHGGVLLSTERLDGEGFALQENGRYAHSRAYIGRVAAASGLRVGFIGEVEIRRAGTAGGWETGDLILLQPVA